MTGFILTVSRRFLLLIVEVTQRFRLILFKLLSWAKIQTFVTRVNLGRLVLI